MTHPTQQGTQPPYLFSPVRLILTGIAGTLGSVLGMVIGLFGGQLIDQALGHPLGRSEGFLSMGFLGFVILVVATPAGTVLGAIAIHKWLGGQGTFGLALVAVILAIGVVGLVSLPERGLAAPALLLLPIAAAVSLEIGHTRQ